MRHFVLFLMIIFISYAQAGYSQISKTDSTLIKNRKTVLYTSTGVIYTTSMTGLYFLWYKDYPTSNFHFFDDNDEWMQMDKVGHFYTSYSVGLLGIDALRWSSVKPKKALWIGGIAGLVFLTNIEVFDGFSSNWGFSNGDMAANLLGASALISQELLWKEQRIRIKFSFMPSQYSRYNPELLGSNFSQNIIKDYNGQTYWASINIHSFLSPTSSFPKWLNLSLGYGAEGMTGATFNPKELNNEPIPEYQRYRQYYLSLDVDLTKIRTRSLLLKKVFYAINFIKIPSPTFMITENGNVRFYPIYF